MTIRSRFAILLSMFGVAVLISLGTAWSSFSLIEREVSSPIQSMASVLRTLREIKRDAEDQGRMLHGESGWRDLQDAVDEPGLEPETERMPLDMKAFTAYTDSMTTNFALLQDQQSWKVRYASSNLLSRIHDAHAAAAICAQTNDPVQRVEVGNELFQIHELIERIEGRILDDTQLAKAFDKQLQRRLLVVLSLVAGLAVLVGLLSLSLVGRWVIRPIEQLRVAAERIGEGEFSYRLVPRGKDELASLATEVNEMAMLVERTQRDRIESERLAAVGAMMRRLAHNIRNPLSGIRGLAEITRKEVEDPDLQESQSRIIDAVDRFEEWLNRLLRATSPAKLDPHEAKVGNWLKGVIEAHQPMASARGVEIACDADSAESLGERVFDPDHLAQALAAVLANAIEVTPEGGTVDIQTNANATTWSLGITDQGPGISKEVLPKLFLPSFTTKRQGTGIGLASAMQAMRGHGGRIEVESLGSTLEAGSEASQAGGARFVLVIPNHTDQTELANNGQSGDERGQDSDR